MIESKKMLLGEVSKKERYIAIGEKSEKGVLNINSRKCLGRGQIKFFLNNEIKKRCKNLEDEVNLCFCFNYDKNKINNDWLMVEELQMLDKIDLQ